MVIEHILRIGELKVCKATEDSRSIIFATITKIESLALVESYVACYCSGMYSQNEGVVQKSD